MNHIKELVQEEKENLLSIIKGRFNQTKYSNTSFDWGKILQKLETNPHKLWSLNEMEKTGGEPNVIDYDKNTDEFIFIDCSIESPLGRRSYCYDRKALEARKANQPKNNVLDVAEAMGITLLNEEQYRKLQLLGSFDTKTSSWLATPENIRKLGGAIFADFRYGNVFVYHNGADSYYATRGFRGALRV